ncbi:MAG: GntR family transcriptional regulator [Spirochaetales bacterium]|nr:GntR family transcriptional regulator [Spirochaetales bacterium]
MKNHACDIDSMVETIRLRILKGEYVPGVKLSENTLSKEFECSRTPIREVLKRLEQDRLVTILPHSGSYVHLRTYEENKEITEIRAYLEALAFRLACERNASVSVLSLLCDQMEMQLKAANVDYICYGQTHFLFHRQLIELSNNNLLFELYDRLNLNNAATLFYGSMTEEEKHVTMEEHRAIVDALVARDADKGESFMFTHLWRKRERLKAMNSKN